MLIDDNNIEHFHGKSRKDINKIVGGKCKSDGCREHTQAKALFPLKEIFKTSKFSIQDCMTKPFKHCNCKERL